MNKNNVVKKDLLRRKVKEYFFKNPSSKSVVVKADVGDHKTLWRVVKEGSSFNVTEVNTQREEFVIELAEDKEEKKEKDKEEKSEKPEKKEPEKTSTKGGKPLYQPMGPTGTVPAAQVKPAVMTPAEPATMTRAAAETEVEKAQEWMPGKSGGKFEKTLGSTKDLNQTLGLMYDDLARKYGDKGAVGIINNILGRAGTKVSSKKDLVSPQNRSLFASYLYKLYPRLKGKFLETKKVQKKVLKEASVEFTNMSKMFTDTMSDLSDHNKLSQTLRTLNTQIGRITDPTEKRQAGMMIGALTGAVDATTAGGGRPKTTPLARITPVKRAVTSSKKLAGKVIKEDDKEDKGKKKVPSEPKKPSNAGLETNIDAPPPEPVEAEPETETEPEAPPPEKKKTEDTAAVSRTLEGQTIKNAELLLTPNGGALVLDLLNSPIPTRLEWDKSGKIVYYHRGVPHTIKRG